MKESLAIHFAYEFVWNGSPTVDVERGPLAGRVAGDYAGTRLSFANINATWKF